MGLRGRAHTSPLIVFRPHVLRRKEGVVDGRAYRVPFCSGSDGFR